LIFLVISGCGDTASNNGYSVDELRQILDGSVFQSKDQYEIGLGPNGEVFGYWYLSFRENECIWDYFDVRDSGAYSISEDGTINADFYNISIDATFDVNTNELVWDGVVYDLQME